MASIAPTRLLNAIVLAWWVRTPRTLAAFSRSVAAIWSDGIYLTSWELPSLILPFFALAFGMYEGVTHSALYGHALQYPAELFMLPAALSLALVVGTLSAQSGLLLVLGYALTDLIYYSPWNYGQASPIAVLFEFELPKLIGFALLFMLVVQPGIVARVLLRSVPLSNKLAGQSRFIANFILLAPLQGVMTLAWCYAAPMVIRPLWRWTSRAVPMTVGDYTPHLYILVPSLAIIAVLLRGVIEWFSLLDGTAWRNKEILSQSLARQQRSWVTTIRRPVWLDPVVTALLITFFTAGFIGSVPTAIAVFVLSAGIFSARDFLLQDVPRWRSWTKLVVRIPLILRWILVILGAALLQWLIFLDPSERANSAASSVTDNFSAELLCLIPALLLFAVLVPKDASPTARQSNLPGSAAKWMAFLILAGCGTSWASPASAICAAPGCCFMASDLTAILSTISFFGLIASAFLLRRGDPRADDDLHAPPAVPKLGFEQPLRQEEPIIDTPRPAWKA